ncbi:MAG: hypothetical protein RLZZ403_1283 [Pseudomonadota bacterium]|jgi:hypothetical protein
MESLCDDCSVEVCDVCAAYFDREDGYGEDGQGVRTHCLCRPCAVERELVAEDRAIDRAMDDAKEARLAREADQEYRRQKRDERNDSGV